MQIYLLKKGKVKT